MLRTRVIVWVLHLDLCRGSKLCCYNENRRDNICRHKSPLRFLVRMFSTDYLGGVSYFDLECRRKFLELQRNSHLGDNIKELCFRLTLNMLIQKDSRSLRAVLCFDMLNMWARDMWKIVLRIDLVVLLKVLLTTFP